MISTLTVTEEDNDIRPGYVFDPASVTTSLTVPEGGTAAYGVKLTAKPTGTVWLGIGWTPGHRWRRLRSGGETKSNDAYIHRPTTGMHGAVGDVDSEGG